MLLIFTHKITSRLTYVANHLFKRILGLEISFTTKVEDFIKHTGPKITYTKQPLQNEFFIRSNELLFEQGISDFSIQIGDWEGVPCFFGTGERSSIPYDVLSASFYLLSRYEEYLPHIKDLHGRFPPSESIAYRSGFLRIPVVDVWAWKLFSKLQERFPQMQGSKRRYSYTSLIDVTSSHCYAHRGFVRSTAGLCMDLGTLKFKRALERFKVWVNAIRDPYDNYEKLIELHNKYGIRSMIFFQFAEYSTYDKNVSPTNEKFRHLIKSVADYGEVSLAASYSSFSDVALLKEEKKRLSGVIHRPVNASRFRYNRVDVPETYRNLVEAEFTDDYTMGYTHEIGFRASTSYTFYFYDINLELQQPIKIHPFAIHDYALLKTKGKQGIMEEIKSLYQEVKAVQGNFITIFSNELLGDRKDVDWLALYENVIQDCRA